MARLSDVPKVFRTVGVIPFALRVWSEVLKDDLFTRASALAFSWLLAVFPFFICILSLLPYLPPDAKEKARDGIEKIINQLPRESAEMIWNNISGSVAYLLKTTTGPLFGIALAFALISASGGMASTMTALDRVYELDRGRPLWKHRLVALFLTVIVAALLSVVIALLPVGTLFKLWLVKSVGISKWAPQVVAFDLVRWSASLFLMLSILMVIYYFGPDVKHRFTWVTPGALFVLVVWVGMGMLFRLYIERIGGRSYARTYGTVGGVAILMMFFYIDALMLLIGGEINSEIDYEVLKCPRGTRDLRCARDLSGGTPTGL